jgi:hypothetical protein
LSLSEANPKHALPNAALSILRTQMTCGTLHLWLARACVVVAWALIVVRPAAAPQDPATRQQTYRAERGPGDAKELHARFSADQIGTLEALNRVDAAHLSSLKELIVPDAWHADLRLFSPFPSRIDGGGMNFPKLLIVHQPGQAFAAYENGHLVRWGPVSTGRALSPTPQGLFHLNWRSPGRHSTVNPRWFMPWYFNFENKRGLSFHEYALPGRPASHACVRLLERDARWLYEWGDGWTLDNRGWEVLAQGTPVLIVGCYAFGGDPLWRSVEWLASGIELPTTATMQDRPCPSSD